MGWTLISFIGSMMINHEYSGQPIWEKRPSRCENNSPTYIGLSWPPKMPVTAITSWYDDRFFKAPKHASDSFARSIAHVIRLVTDHVWLIHFCLVGGWPTPPKNMKVSWDYDIPKIWKNKKNVPNHQPDICSIASRIQMSGNFLPFFYLLMLPRHGWKDHLPSGKLT